MRENQIAKQRVFVSPDRRTQSRLKKSQAKKAAGGVRLPRMSSSLARAMAGIMDLNLANVLKMGILPGAGEIQPVESRSQSNYVEPAEAPGAGKILTAEEVDLGGA